jgi:hypothetical protein
VIRSAVVLREITSRSNWQLDVIVVCHANFSLLKPPDCGRTRDGAQVGKVGACGGAVKLVKMCSNPKEYKVMKFLPPTLKSSNIMAFVVFTLILLLCRPIEAQRYLYNVTDLGIGNNPAGVVSADFNHDGRPDLAVTNFTDNNVSVIWVKATDSFFLRWTMSLEARQRR